MHFDAVLADLRDAGLDALLVSTPSNTYYVCGFRAIAYSRPVLVVVGEQSVLTIPELEETQARATSGIPTIRTYPATGLWGLGGKSALLVEIDRCLDAMRESGPWCRPSGLGGGIGSAALHPLRPRGAARGLGDPRDGVHDRRLLVGGRAHHFHRTAYRAAAADL